MLVRPRTKARGRAEVDDTRSSRGVLLEGVDVRHDVVPHALLLIGSNLEGLVADDEVGADGVEGLVGDLVDAQLLLSLGQPEPELAPRRVALARREDLAHLATCPSCVRPSVLLASQCPARGLDG